MATEWVILNIPTPKLSIIIPSSRPRTLAHVLTHINNQRTDVPFEVIIVQEAVDYTDFMHLHHSPLFTVIRQRPSGNCGATARDRGFMEAVGEFVVFWDDDNVYYSNAIDALYQATRDYDVGVVKTRHQNVIIPSGKKIKAGDIDTMCLCVRRSVAAGVRWADGGGRYNDFRWISKVLKLTDKVNFVPIVVGEHI